MFRPHHQSHPQLKAPALRVFASLVASFSLTSRPYFSMWISGPGPPKYIQCMLRAKPHAYHCYPRWGDSDVDISTKNYWLFIVAIQTLNFKILWNWSKIKNRHSFTKRLLQVNYLLLHSWKSFHLVNILLVSVDTAIAGLITRSIIGVVYWKHSRFNIDFLGTPK